MPVQTVLGGNGSPPSNSFIKDVISTTGKTIKLVGQFFIWLTRSVISFVQYLFMGKPPKNGTAAKKITSKPGPASAADQLSKPVPKGIDPSSIPKAAGISGAAAAMSAPSPSVVSAVSVPKPAIAGIPPKPPVNPMPKAKSPPTSGGISGAAAMPAPAPAPAPSPPMVVAAAPVTLAQHVAAATVPAAASTHPLSLIPSSLASKIQISVPDYENQNRAVLVANRQPVTNILGKFFQLDSFGYIVSTQDSIDLKTVVSQLNADEQVQQLDAAFELVAAAGDAGFAHEIRTALAYLGIGSIQVSKTDGKVVPSTVRPNSYRERKFATGNPPVYKKGPSYISHWEKTIWDGYRKFRMRHFGMRLGFGPTKTQATEKGKDSGIIPQQLAHYEHSVKEILSLHQTGDLCERCASLGEADDFVNGRYQMHNDILSVSLLPRLFSRIKMRLFTEYGGVTVGLLINPKKVHKNDFGVSFPRNAKTSGTGFIAHKKRVGQDGASGYEAQKQLYEEYEARLSAGENIAAFQPKLSADHSRWVLPKEDVRAQTKAITQKQIEVGHNEQTFYRGAENDLCTGFFIKSNSDNLSEELKQAYELQDKVRRTKGRFIPIFLLDGEKNTLEELPPDSILIKVLGLQGRVTPIVGHKSRFGRMVESAGITEVMAQQMIDALPSQSASIKTLFDLQLLLFNLRDLTGSIGVKKALGADHYVYEDVRVIDNLHLVFPTIHQTKNPTAEKGDLFFSIADMKSIHASTVLSTYLQHTVKFNLQRFLGIKQSIDGQISFNTNVLKLFDQTDKKKSDFAKVLARAMQSAILFDVFGTNTQQVVIEIVQSIRQTAPLLGITSNGIDMILGSQEMQKILQEKRLGALAESMALEPARGESAGALMIPQLADNLGDSIAPFGTSHLPAAEQFYTFLGFFGLNCQTKKFSVAQFQQYLPADPYLEKSEQVIRTALQWLGMQAPQDAEWALSAIRAVYPAFGFSVMGEDLMVSSADRLMSWLIEQQQGKVPTTEFPFTAVAPVEESSAYVEMYGRRFMRRGGGADAVPQYPVRGRGMRGGPSMDEEAEIAAASMSQPIAPITITAQKFSKDPALLQRYNGLVGTIDQTDPRYNVLVSLGLINQDGDLLWNVEPEFNQGDTRKPMAPYIELKDVLGVHCVELLSGPAYHPTIFQQDCKSVEVTANLAQWRDWAAANVSDRINRFLTHILAFVTDGDKQVLRQNGLQYSSAVTPPAGGFILYNPGNERHWFREGIASVRRFFGKQTSKPGQREYTGLGEYSEHQLRIVQDYDDQLLSDFERRMKRVSILKSGFITVTAKGGYNSPRVPLERAHRVLYLNTAGAQFEKYGVGDFVNDRGQTFSNELEATDFIIKVGAQENQDPMIKSYYPGNKIPAHGAVNPAEVGVVGDADASKNYVKMVDGALFNRQAFQTAQDHYFEGLILPTIERRIGEKPIYLKATLFGGGFFAKAGATDLREEVLHSMILSYTNQIAKGRFMPGSVIEFPAYGEIEQLPQQLRQNLLAQAQAKGVHLVWSPKGDIFDFEPKTTVSKMEVSPKEFEQQGALVCLGAADAMSFDGNEAPSVSVEAMMGNNSNLRGVMNVHSNKNWLDPARYHLGIV